MKKFMLLLLGTAVIFAFSSCDEQPSKKEGAKKQKHYREKYREQHQKDRQERKW